MIGHKIKVNKTSYKPQPSLSSRHFYNNEELSLITKEVDKLITIGAIEKCSPCHDQFVSPCFLVDKSDGTKRKILNLKSFNQHIPYEHFKMENLKFVCDLIKPSCFMTSVDLHKAYYSVAVHCESRKYLRFIWQSTLYQYRALPNGLASAPRIFTRLLKPLFAHLRKLGTDCVYYLDDSVILAETFKECKLSTDLAINLFTKAGFTVNVKKSVTIPKQRIKFLGFIIDSVDMKIYLPAEKQEKLISEAKTLLAHPRVKILKLAQVIGMIVAYMPAFIYGKLHYRGLELDKIAGLKLRTYQGFLTLSSYAKQDLQWWIENAKLSGSPVKSPIYDVELFTDASLTGCGAMLNDVSIGSKWTKSELCSYGDNINCLELLAVFYAVKSFMSQLKGQCICVRIDNMTAVSYINNMGGTHSLKCNIIARDIWNICIENGIYLHASYIPGRYNVEADYASRNFNDDIEITLQQSAFGRLSSSFNIYPYIDLFASRHNCKVKVYASWKPDSGATYVDAFTLNWNDFNCIYIFPPFSLWGRIISKLAAYKGEALVIYPDWPAQFWYADLNRMVSNKVSIEAASVQAPVRLQTVRYFAGRITYGRN